MFRHGLKRAMANVGGEQQRFIGHTTFTTTIRYLQNEPVPYTATIDIPSGAESGDLLIIAMGADGFNSPYTTGTATGFSAYPENYFSFSYGIGAIYKILDGTEGSSITVSFAGDVANLVMHAMLFRGLTLNTTGTLPDADVSSGTAPTYNATTATNAVDDVVLTLALLDDDTGISVISPSTGYTVIGLDQSSSNGNTPGQSGTLLTQYKVLTSTATESPSSPTLSGFDDEFATLTLQLQTVTYNYETPYGTPDYTITTFPSTGAGVGNGTNDALIAIDANISSTDDGVLMEAGGTGNGLSIGVSNGTLRVRGYDGSTVWTSIVDANTAYLDIDISSYTGKFCTYYFAFDTSNSRQLKAYVQVGGKGSVNQLVSLGTNSAPSFTDPLYGTGGKGYGTTNAATADLEAAYQVDFNGTIDEIRYWAEDAALDVSTFGT